VGVGIWKDFSQVDQMVQIASEARPHEDHRTLYEELYEIFNESYRTLEHASVFRRLAVVDTA
jgi:hypothetical protein